MYHRVVISAEYYFMKVYIYNMYTNMKHTHAHTHRQTHKWHIHHCQSR